MSQRHTFLFGTVLAVAGAAVVADHYLNDTNRKPVPAAQRVAVEPVAAPVPIEAAPQEAEIMEFAPCSASMDGMMMGTSVPKPAPAPKPAAKPTPSPAQQDEIIEFAPCSAGF